jgi:hypothetical protein
MYEEIKKMCPYFELPIANRKKCYTLISRLTILSIVILLILLSISFFCFKQGFIKNPLLIPGVLFIFVLFDFSVFLFNIHIDYVEKKRKNNHQDSEPLKYYPNLKLWGMGFILGLAVFIFGYFEPLKDALLGKSHIQPDKLEIVLGQDMKILDSRVTSMELIRQIAVLLFFLAVLGIILAAIVRILKDEW